MVLEDPDDAAGGDGSSVVVAREDLSLMKGARCVRRHFAMLALHDFPRHSLAPHWHPSMPYPAQHTHHTCSDTMMTVISDLLDYARLEAGAFSITLRPVPVREMVQSAVRQMAPFAEGMRVRLELQVNWLRVDPTTGEVAPDPEGGGSGSGDPLILADATRIGQVLTNYISCVTPPRITMLLLLLLRHID